MHIAGTQYIYQINSPALGLPVFGKKKALFPHDPPLRDFRLLSVSMLAFLLGGPTSSCHLNLIRRRKSYPSESHTEPGSICNSYHLALMRWPEYPQRPRYWVWKEVEPEREEVGELCHVQYRAVITGLAFIVLNTALLLLRFWQCLPTCKPLYYEFTLSWNLVVPEASFFFFFNNTFGYKGLKEKGCRVFFVFFSGSRN